MMRGGRGADEHLTPLHPHPGGSAPGAPAPPLPSAPALQRPHSPSNPTDSRSQGVGGCRRVLLPGSVLCVLPSLLQQGAAPPPSPSALHAEAEISEITFNYSHYFPWECWSERQHLAVSRSRAVPFLLPPAAARGAAPIATRASRGGREGALGENRDGAVGSGDGYEVLGGLGMGSRLPPGSGRWGALAPSWLVAGG